MRIPDKRILGLVGLLAAGLVVYSQTRAFAWDEGFHLLAAQSIGHGKRPYLDFPFSQAPLNAYWNAGWMRVFGESWRTSHAVAAVMTSLAVLLTAGYLLRRFPVPGWRLATAITAVFVVGMNAMVLEFGTIGQAYGLCLFLIVAAFRLTVAAVEGPLLYAALAGLLACVAANASLLTAPVAPVLLLWMFLCNRTGNRWAKTGAFVGAGSAAFLPLAWLFVQGPRQTIFFVVKYELLYRQVKWEGAAEHNLAVFTSWIDSSQPLMLGMLALAGLLFVSRQSGWQRAQRLEFYLCGWLALALTVHISSAIPTFSRYYLLAAPFLGILACAGLYVVGSRLGAPDRPFWPVLVVILLSCLFVAKVLYDTREDFAWSDAELVAAKVRAVTPPQAVLYADEHTYFLTRHAPPSGMELADSHKLDFPPPVAAELHLISQSELDRRLKAGVFDTVEIPADDERIQKFALGRLYSGSAEVGEAKVFWRRAPR